MKGSRDNETPLDRTMPADTSRPITNLAARMTEDEVGVHILLSNLLGHVQPQRAIFIVDVSLRLIRENCMRPIDFLELSLQLGQVKNGKLSREA